MYILNYVILYVLLTWAIELVTVIIGSIATCCMLCGATKDDSYEDSSEHTKSIMSDVVESTDLPEEIVSDDYHMLFREGAYAFLMGLLSAPIFWPLDVAESIKVLKELYRLTHQS